MTVEWPARLAANWDADLIDKDGNVVGRVRAILCGAPDCTGLVGWIMFHHNVLGLQVYAPNGYRESEPGRWLMTSHARKRLLSGKAPRTEIHLTQDGRHVRITPHATVPYTIPCWRCRTVARVGVDVVASATT